MTSAQHAARPTGGGCGNGDVPPSARRLARCWDSVEIGDLANEETFARFYVYTVSLLEHSLRRDGAGYEEAQDLAHDTMLLLYRKRSEIGRPVAYALATARRVFIRHRMSAWVRLEFSADDDLWASLGILDYGEAEQLAVLEVIASLPAQQRRVLALRYDGYTPTEIAEMLQTTPNNVRVTLHHARRRLRSRMIAPVPVSCRSGLRNDRGGEGRR
jgi:RNA polymerase sigma factor (sigma-70 family)